MVQTVRFADSGKGAEKELQDTSKKMSNAKRLLSAIESQMPKEVHKQEGIIATSKKEYGRLSNEADAIGSGNADYQAYKQKMAGLTKAFDRKQARKASTLFTRLPPDLVAADNKAEEALQKYETEQDKLQVLKDMSKAIKDYNKNVFDRSFKEGDADAFKDIKELAKKAGLFNQKAFEQEMDNEEKKSKQALKDFGKEGREVWKLDNMFHEAEQYAAKSGRASILYGVRQAFGLKSVEGQTETLLDMLSTIDFKKLQLEMADMEKNVAKLNILAEVRAEGKKAAAASGQFLDSLTRDDAKSYGLSNTVLLRAPELLIDEAKKLASEGLIGKEQKRVMKFEEELAKWTDQKDKKRIDRVNSMFYVLQVDLGWAIPETLDLNDPERKEMQILRQRVIADVDKKVKQLGLNSNVKLEQRTIPNEQIRVATEHLQDLVSWKEDEIIDLSMKTYSKILQVANDAYGIKPRDFASTLDDYVREQLELKFVVRGAKVPATQTIAPNVAFVIVPGP